MEELHGLTETRRLGETKKKAHFTLPMGVEDKRIRCGSCMVRLNAYV